jgi:hypothetical protein
LVLLVGLGGLGCLGFGSALVLADRSKNPNGAATVSGEITICHSPPGNPNGLQLQVHTAKSIVESNGHISHPGDIIPAFPYTADGTTTIYEGKNLHTTYPLSSAGSGFTGEKVLEDHGCEIPTGAGITTGKISETTIPVAITEPGPTLTEPATTRLETVTEAVVVPRTTEAAPPTTTVVTVPPHSTTTVTLPERTVTVPPSTDTVEGETVVRPSEIVTLPATSQTETGGATTAVETVTGPDEVVEPGERASKDAVVTVTIAAEIVHEPPRVVILPDHRIAGDAETETVPTTVTEPATTITVPAATTAETVTERVAVPATTATVSEEKTVVTVPPGSTTTVTLPERTVTVPRSRETTDGETVVRGSEVVTLPATTQTVTGTKTPAVVTITGPRKVVEAGARVVKQTVVIATTPGRGVFKPRRVVHAEEVKLVVIVVHAMPCPPGKVPDDATCSHIGPGKG